MYRNTKTYYAIKQAPVSKVFLAKILPMLASNSKFKLNGLFCAPDFAVQLGDLFDGAATKTN